MAAEVASPAKAAFMALPFAASWGLFLLLASEYGKIAMQEHCQWHLKPKAAPLSCFKRTGFALLFILSAPYPLSAQPKETDPPNGGIMGLLTVFPIIFLSSPLAIAGKVGFSFTKGLERPKGSVLLPFLFYKTVQTEQSGRVKPPPLRSCRSGPQFLLSYPQNPAKADQLTATDYRILIKKAHQPLVINSSSFTDKGVLHSFHSYGFL